MFKQVHKDWIAYNDKLVDYMVATGIISKGKAKDVFWSYCGPKFTTLISTVKISSCLRNGSRVVAILRP